MIVSRKVLIIVAAFVLMALGLPGSVVVHSAAPQTIAVTSANPPSGEQGTLNLDVVIGGKNFKSGAKAAFFKTGTADPAGVNVKSTRYVSSTQVVANIDIADTAALSAFDIQVQNADGRTGKGTELFSVLAKKIDPCTLPDPAPTPSAYVTEQPGYPGYLDGTFGSGTGRVVGPRHLTPRAAAVDAQGRIVVVGVSTDACSPSATRVWTVARYLPSGALDPTFGPSGGGVVMRAPWGEFWAEDVAIQPDGKILVGGSSPASRKGNADSRPTIARYNADGSVDTGFGAGGVVLVTGTADYDGGFAAIAIQADGKIVAAGSWFPYALAVRLLPDGTLDGTFGIGGQRLLNTEHDGVAHGYDVAIQTIGSEQYILVGGTRKDTWTDRYMRFALWRLTSSGTPDTSFGTAGVVATAFQFPDAEGKPTDSYADELMAIAVDSENRIVAAGYMDATGPADADGQNHIKAELARYDVNGTLDPTFGDGGKVVLLSQSGPVEFATAMGIQTDGCILLGGWGGGANAAIVWRIEASGSPDLSFGASGGRIEHSIANGENHAALGAMALLPDGKVISVGNVLVLGTPDLRFAFFMRVWQ